MRIVIDFQGIQSRYQELGLFQPSISYIEALLHENKGDQIFFAVSNFYPNTIEPIRAKFDGLIDQVNICIWYAPSPIHGGNVDNLSRYSVAQLIFKSFLSAFRPDALILTGIFGDHFSGELLYGAPQIDLNVPIIVSGFEELRNFQKIQHQSKIDARYGQMFNQRMSLLNNASLILCLSKDDNKKMVINYITSKELNKINFVEEISLANDIVCKEHLNLWIEAANNTILYLNKDHQDKLGEHTPPFFPINKRLLAFVSPLPPERTGIADYSSELIPLLSKYYDIECVVMQNDVDDLVVENHAKIRNVAWLRENASNVDRIIYHIGNSPNHQHMITLLREIPGVVVLHDFFLGHLMEFIEGNSIIPRGWIKELHRYHGYPALSERFNSDVKKLAFKYPACGSVIEDAYGVIAHSKYVQNLASQWYGNELASKIKIIPLLRAKAEKLDKNIARKKLGLSVDDFIICSFGFLNSMKLNDRLLSAWEDSELSKDVKSKLFFVGENSNDGYGEEINRQIKSSSYSGRVKITGFVSPEIYKLYLMAADIAVQLRVNSRGESSASLLDCMNYGIPVICNANESLAEFDTDSILMMPEKFDNVMLVTALDKLWANKKLRHEMSIQGEHVIRANHDPGKCASLYYSAIENFYAINASSKEKILRQISFYYTDSSGYEELLDLARRYSLSSRPIPLIKRLLIDVSVVSKNDFKTGIQRVVRALVLALINEPLEGYKIELVSISDQGGRWHLRTAKKYGLELLDCPNEALDEEEVEPQNGDIFLGLDLSGGQLSEAEREGLFRYYHHHGVKLFAVVYDLLPITLPEVFPPPQQKGHENWALAISNFDGAICISNHVASELNEWRKNFIPNQKNRRSFKVGWFHLGADFQNSAPTHGIPPNGERALVLAKEKITFLMVGTVEPRKGYLQVIEAFTFLWAKGYSINLMIIGKEGWKDLSGVMRRDIPQTVDKIINHLELNKSLFWFEGVSDEFLGKLYKASSCLIAASYDEGFGLPLIEAAQHGIPIIARDIPVFREVASQNAFYFKAKNAHELALAIEDWLRLKNENKIPKSYGMKYLKWCESAEELKKFIFS